MTCKKLCAIFVCFVLFSKTLMIDTDAYDFMGYKTGTLEQVLNEYKKEKGMNETNFGFAYFNTVTGDEYYDNADKWMTGGSTYKFPLNMYLYKLQNEGKLKSSQYIKGERLSSLQYKSIVYSDNAASTKLFEYLGYYNFKKGIAQFSDVEIPEEFYSTNIFSARYMMDALKHLYYHSADYEKLLSHMLIASPNKSLKKYVKEYDIAYKTGTFEGAYNSVGIVYTPTPYLISVYTQGYSYDIIGEINRIVCDYTLAQTADKSALNLSVFIKVDGKEYYVQCYNIEGSFYLKMSDVAGILSKSMLKFEVKEEENKTEIIPLKEMPYQFSFRLKPLMSTATIADYPFIKEGKRMFMKTYLIEGEYFVRLRDVARSFDFGLSWDDTKRMLSINTIKIDSNLIQ